MRLLRSGLCFGLGLLSLLATLTATAAYAELGAALSGIREDKIIEPFEEPIVYGSHENYHSLPSYSVAAQLDQAGTVDLPELRAAVERVRDSVQADAVMRVTLNYGTRPETSLMVYETGPVTATLELEIMRSYENQRAYSSILVNAWSDRTYGHWFTADAEQFPELVSEATEHALAKLEERVLGPVDS